MSCSNFQLVTWLERLGSSDDVSSPAGHRISRARATRQARFFISPCTIPTLISGNRLTTKYNTMSDFASLLGSLQKSAKQAKEDARSGRGSTGQQDRKRRAPTATDDSSTTTSNAKKHRPPPREPRDKRELTLSVSFFCIGAQKAGTTWLHEMLRQHPSLCLPTEKELHFWDWHRRKGLGWYCRQFPNTKAKGSAKYGECTPCYMTLSESDIAEIKLLFPHAKLIFLARDLIDRAWSAILMELRNAVRGVEVGKFTINDKTDKRQLEQMDKESNPDNYDDD